MAFSKLAPFLRGVNFQGCAMGIREKNPSERKRLYWLNHFVNMVIVCTRN